MRIFILMIFVISGVFANVCEANKQKIEDKILWSFISNTTNDYVELCESLHTLYPQMKANECQVVKVTQTQRSELCELLVAQFKSYGVKSNKNDCKYTKTDKYVKDIKNLPSVLRKYVFNVKPSGDVFAPPNECIAKISAKYKYEVTDEVMEKIKSAFKKINDENKTYLKFMQDEHFQNEILQIYRLVGDKMLSDVYKYHTYKTTDLMRQIKNYEDYWAIPIKYEVIDWSELRNANWLEKYKEIYDSSYAIKCYNKSPQDIVTINYGKESSYGEDKTKDMTCAEVKSQMELFERAIKD